ncbi:TipAS antibiotic-recognition domain-containing protein [soil metagenome]
MDWSMPAERRDHARAAQRDRAAGTLDWSIADIARLAGTTSRTLRHYDAVGLVKPSRIGDNGYRYYDADALVKLQRVLLLRELGLSIPAIGEVLAGQRDNTVALRTHLDWLTHEQERIERQRASVERTIKELEGGEKPMAEKMFDGFDHTHYKDEVEQRWGKESYAKSDGWWRSLSQSGKDDFMLAAAELIEDWKTVASSGAASDSDEAQAVARRQYDWLSGIPGTPRTAEDRASKDYYTGLAEMYVADERFAKNYGGDVGATFVRDAMLAFAERNL